MDASDKSNIEKFIYNPMKCTGLIMLKEFYDCGSPRDCPYKKQLKQRYENEQEQQQERESGLI